MDNPSKEQILAASSGWVATTLNFLPGLGTGYLYQRRWGPYFITAGIATTWFILGGYINNDIEQTKFDQLTGIGGLFIISIVTMIEAKIAHNKVVIAIEEQFQAKSEKKKRGLFRKSKLL
tara:strand:- start:594 stop:953 length:360 start_codon:yes stop_codon:yes gene_type:complete